MSDDVIADARRLCPRAFGLPAGERWRRSALQLGFAALVVFCFWWTGFTVERLLDGLSRLGWLLPHMVPPTHGGWLGELLYALGETLAMAFLGTLTGAVLGLFLGLMGARNIVPAALVRFGLRRLFDVLRGIDSLIWALIFVGVVGLGPFAGILAIAVSDTGTLAKLFSEAIENVDKRPVDGVVATGASPPVVVRFGVLPQVFPVLLSQTLYFFESNIRSATILGIVGAGGIGLQLSDRIRINEWDQVAFIVVMILVTVAVIDHLSGWLRMRLVGRRER